MLTAHVNNRLVTAFHHSRGELLKLRSSTPAITCPHCCKPLVLKIGSKTIPHFAHQLKQDCPVMHKGESRIHHSGKKILYDRFHSLFPEVKVEYFLKEINQIADVFITSETARMAVEVQCSTLSAAELKKRTEGYRSLGIQVIWLLTEGAPRPSGTLRLSSFQQAFLRHAQPLGLFLLLFLPDQQEFHLYQNLIPLSANTFHASTLHKIPVSEFTIPMTTQAPERSIPYKIWDRSRTGWIQRILRYPTEQAFKQEVYQSGDTLLYLPQWVGLLPHYRIETHPVIWQYYLWSDALKKGDAGLGTIVSAMAVRAERGDVRVRDLPLVDQGGCPLEEAVKWYLSLLEKLGMVRMEGGMCRLLQEWECPATFDLYMLHRADFSARFRI
ncbi:competence protein CoiA [Rossellomorea marisflavi]|uniref:competence protein CoiA n=1 Tax=Rossellomorea marisflavi TaxID=189381 RepID=UPI003458D320